MIPNLDISENKERIAIVVVGYNRLSTLKRLTQSLIDASYDSSDIPLVYSIDASGNQEVYNYVNNVEWPHGIKYVSIQQERLGLRKHIYFCGDFTKYFKGVIILEDDVFVAPDFYRYTKAAVDKYYLEDRIAGISLFADQTNGYAQGIPNYRLKDGSDAYLLQEVCTSGECFTDRMWIGFRNWLEKNIDTDPTPYYMPESIKHWTHAWSKYYNMYLLDHDYYYLSPYLSVTTNCGTAGVHSDSDLNYLHADMQWGHKKEYCFNDFDDCVKYDIFGSYIGLDKVLNILKDELVVDLYGNKPLTNTAKYLLSPYILPYRIIKSYGLNLEPMEMNVIHGIEGNDLFLYDLTIAGDNNPNRKLTYHQISYHLRGTSYRILLRYVAKTIKLLTISHLKQLITNH